MNSCKTIITITILSLTGVNSIHLNFKFDGNYVDSSNGYNTIITGTRFSYDRYMNENKSLYFDGQSSIQILNTNSVNLMTQFSLLSWVNLETSSHIMAKYEHYYSNGFAFVVNDDGVKLTLNNCQLGNEVYVPGDFIGEWHCIIAIFNGSVGSIYIDGTIRQRNYVYYTIPSPDTIRIGSANLLPGGKGYFDDINIYDHVILEDVITQYCATMNQIHMNEHTNDGYWRVIALITVCYLIPLLFSVIILRKEKHKLTTYGWISLAIMPIFLLIVITIEELTYNCGLIVKLII